MAIFQSFLLGNVRKSVANLTMYIAKGVCIVRGKPLNVHNPNTDKQRTQRLKVSVLMTLLGGFRAVLHAGYSRLGGLIQPGHCFVRDNLQAVTVDDVFKATVDFSKLIVCADGGLKTPKVAVKYDEQSKSMVFTQTIQGKTLRCNVTDIGWVIAYEKVQNEAEIYELKNRKEGGEVRQKMPEDWVIDNCEFYAFARNLKGTSCSKTVYLVLDTNEEG